MRLLFVSPCIPIPIDCGQHLRTYDLILACARQFEVTFVGNVAYGANGDAVKWFSTHVLPLLRERYDGIVLDVIGPNVPDDLSRELSGAVRFRGFVDDLHAALADYDVTVAPLRFGGGTKLKVLDALAADVPLVTTPVGGEDIGLVPGTHALIASSASDFATVILPFADDPQRAAAIARQRRELVEKTIPWPALQGRLAEWPADKAERKRRRGDQARWLVSASGLHGAEPRRAGNVASEGQPR